MATSIFETTITAPVYFMIGSQRSGSNWLRTMLSEREDLIAPHPPHIMRDFMPLLPKYGDLDDFSNLKVSEVKIVTWFAILVYPLVELFRSALHCHPFLFIGIPEF